MGKKLVINILYNVGIILCAVMIYWSVDHHRYDWTAAGIFIVIVIAILKIRLVKEVRLMQKDNAVKSK